MAPPADSWPDGNGNGLPPPPPPSHQDQLNRQMIRHLMTQYSNEEMQRIWHEETRTAHSDTASVFTSSTHSSVKSEDAQSVFDSGSSIRTVSDTSSSRGSIISNVSAKFLSRKSRPSVTSVPASSQSQTEDLVWDGDDGATTASGDASSITGAPKQKGAFMCGFCKEENIQKTCTRKNDLKRHIEDFHNMNAQWFCRHRGCQMVFDWQTAYKTHLKHAHGGSRMSLDDAKVILCPQTVFACGFERCTQVFEASTDDDANSIFKEYVAHVVKHFDEGINSGDWTYSARIRNLLRQSGVFRAWNNSSWSEADRSRLIWYPQSSGTLRKRLETRHIGDLQMLIQYAIMTGSNPGNPQKLRDDFVIPKKDECQLIIPGHKIRAQPANGTAVPMEAEPEFRISRGANPGLAAYMASQRRVYVPRAPVRSGRSARPPMRTVPSQPQTPMTPQYGYPTNTAPMYDARQQQQQQYAMLSQTNGGIIAEDLRSLRTMTSHSSEGDVEMGDTQMVDPGYMPQHQGFPGQYANGMTSAETADGCGLATPPGSMEPHEHQFVHYGASHTY